MGRVRWMIVFAVSVGLVACTVSCSEAPPLVLTSFIERLDSASIVAELGEIETVGVRLVTAGGEERVAIATYAPSEIVFSLTVPPNAWLRSGVGSKDQARRSAQADGVRVSVWVRAGENPRQTIWSTELPGVDAPWTELEVPLDAWEGRLIQIGFSSENLRDATGDHVAWSRPILTSVPDPDRAPAQAVPSTIPAFRIEEDLLDHPGVQVDGCRVRAPGVTVAAGGGVDLAVQALRDPEYPRALLGPVRIELKVDGVSVFSRRAGSLAGEITVPARVDLSAFAGRTVDLDFEVCDESGGTALIWYKRIWLTSLVETPRSAPDGWNLLFLLVDTLRADRVGHYGYSRPTTPHWDKLARTSQVFMDVTATASWTQPSVATLFTGLSPVEHGVVEGVPLPLGTPTLPEVLQREGFTTLAVSSNPIVGALEGFHRGFENFVQAPWARAEHLNRVFLDWLDRAQDLRWFAYLHYIDPHGPYGAPGTSAVKFSGRCETAYASEGGLNQLSEAINFGRGEAAYSQADIDCLSDLYDGEIHYWDSQLGLLVKELKRRGQLDRTLVVITSDHGEEFMEHGHILHGYSLYQETVHVPLTIRTPGETAGQPRVYDVVSLQDLPDALYHLLGVRNGEPPRLLAPHDPAPVFAHTTESWKMGTGYTALASIRDEDVKFIFRPEDGTAELFDLETDPLEQKNRVVERATVAAGIKERLAAWLAGAKTHTLETRGMDDDTLEKLRALGYIR